MVPCPLGSSDPAFGILGIWMTDDAEGPAEDARAFANARKTQTHYDRYTRSTCDLAVELDLLDLQS